MTKNTKKASDVKLKPAAPDIPQVEEKAIITKNSKPANSKGALLRLNNARAEKFELENLKTKGMLVSVGEMENSWMRFVAHIRSRIGALPHSMSYRLMNISDPNKITDELKSEIDRIFLQIAEDGKMELSELNVVTPGASGAHSKAANEAGEESEPEMDVSQKVEAFFSSEDLAESIPETSISEAGEESDEDYEKIFSRPKRGEK